MFKNEIQKKIDDIRSAVAEADNLNADLIQEEAAKWMRVLLNGNKIALVGNGGSAAEAMHIAAEFTGRCVVDHDPWNVVCLNESQSAITAIANDYGVEQIFARQVQAHLSKGDLLIALSTSGSSRNILEALLTAKNKDVATTLWMGDFESPLKDLNCWKVQSISTPRIQEIHLMWGHLIAETIELMMANIMES